MADDGAVFWVDELAKVKRLMERMDVAEPDDLYYFASDAEIGNWEFVCWLKLNRIKIVNLKPLPLWKTPKRKSRRHR